MTTAAVPFAVLASRLRADEKRILEACERRGLPYDYIDCRTLWQELRPPGASRRVVLNREIGLARALRAAQVLEAAGAVVVNSARAVELCGDKYRTSVALRDTGLPTPRTALALTPQAALDALDAIGYPAVMKPLSGSWGRLVSRITDRATAETVLEYIAALPSPEAHLVYVQELVQKPDRDIRVIVIGDEALGATYRRGAGWRTNIARGATAEPCPLGPDLAKLAVAAAQSVHAEIAGVDLIEDAAGDVAVLEVNHGVEFSGFQSAVGPSVPVADRIVDYMLEKSRSCAG